MPQTCTTLFVKNLSYDLDENDIEDHFKSFGLINEVRLVRSK